MFRKSKGVHIFEHQGHKQMSLKNEVVTFLNPEYVYIPLIEQNAPCDILVQVGQTVKIGDVIANKTGFFASPIHAPISGEVVSVNMKMWHASGKMVATIQIKNDFKETKVESIKPRSAKELEKLSKEEIVEIVRQNGVVGLGGSGFPAYGKLRVKNPIDVIIINAVECEPYITTDYSLMTSHLDKLIRGIRYLIKAVDANKAVIAIKENKVEMIEKIKQALQNDGVISVFPLKDEYPAGWEKYIVQRVTNKTYKSLPSEAGAVVNNVGTAIALCDAVEQNMPLVEKLVTITGSGLKNPTNVLVKIGTKVSDIIEKIGGYVDDLGPAYFIAGGPMTGKAIMFDTLVVHRALSSVIVFPKDIRENNPPCMGCGKCVEVCPVFLAPIQIKEALEAKDIDALKELRAEICMQCGLCSYVCPSRIELTDATTKAKTQVLQSR